MNPDAVPIPDDDGRRWYTVAVTKIPEGERDRAQELLAGREFYDCIGADTPDNDRQFPVGADCLYAVQLTDAEAADLARNGESTGEGNNIRAVEPDVLADPATAPVPIPADATLRYMRADAASIDSTVWHGRDQTVAVLDQGTTQAVRDRMGCVLVGRTNTGAAVPAGQELHAATDGRASGFFDHGCLVAPNAVPAGGRLLDVLVIGTDGRGPVSAFAAGVRYAVDQGVRIINHSFSGVGTESQAYVDALTYARDAEAEVFLSAGNDNLNALGVPASYSRQFDNVHSVIAFDERNNARASFSNYAADASGCAPGVGIVSLTPAGVVTSWNGTSAASPLGASDCARGGTGGRFTARQVGAALKANVRDTGHRAAEQGAGAYDLRRALIALGAAPALPMRRNPSPRPSAEVDVTGHTVGGASSPGAPTRVSTGGRVGAGWASSTAGTAGSHQFFGPTFPTSPGQVHNPSVFFRRSSSSTAGARIYTDWFNAAGASLGYSSVGPPLVPGPGADIWHRLSQLGAVAPAGAATGRPSTWVTDAVAGEVIGVDGWLPESGPVGIAPGIDPYFDGSTSGGKWLGTPHASASLLGFTPSRGAAYRAMPGYTSSSTYDAGTGRTVGLEFSVAEFSWLSTIWVYRPSVAVAIPSGDVAGVWTVTPGSDTASTTGALVAGSTAVTWPADVGQTGWIPGTLAVPILLAPGIVFRVGVWGKGILHGASNYFATGNGKDGFTAGPLRVPSAANAVNLAQGVYTAGTGRTFPNTVAKTNYGIDVSVEPDPELIQGENGCPNPACAVDATDWTQFASTGGSGGRVTDLTGAECSTGYRATQGATATQFGIYAPYFPVEPSQTVSARFTVIGSVGIAGAFTLSAYDSGRGFISGSRVEVPQTLVANTAANKTVVITTPTNAAFVRLYFVSSGVVAAAATLIGTAARYRRGSWPALSYLDGDTPKCVWDDTPGKSTSRRAPRVYAADTDSSATTTVGTAIGYTGTHRQDGAGVFVTNPAPIPVEAAPYARPGRASRFDIATGYQRVEQNPDHRSFADGDDYWFGFAFALAPGFPTWVNDFFVIEQLHGAPSTGSPVLAFETRGYSLRLSGGANRPGASSPGQYAYDRLLIPNLRVNRWYHVVYRVVFSAIPGGGSIDVWVDGVQRLAGFAPPCGTVYDTDISTEGGPSYLKLGAYKRPALEGGTLWHAGTALGTSYAAVDPTRSQLVVTSESMAPAYC